MNTIFLNQDNVPLFKTARERFYNLDGKGMTLNDWVAVMDKIVPQYYFNAIDFNDKQGNTYYYILSIGVNPKDKKDFYTNGMIAELFKPHDKDYKIGNKENFIKSFITEIKKIVYKKEQEQ